MFVDQEFIIERCSPEEADSIYAFLLDHFLEDEYLNCAVGYKRTDIRRLLNEHSKNGVRSGVSCKCTEKATGKIVGCRVSSTKNDKEEEQPHTNNYHWKEKAILDIMGVIFQNLDDHLPDAGKVLSFEAMAINSDYRRKGLAKAMIEENMRIGKEAGCTHVVVLATNVRSQKLFEKLGYQKLKELRYSDYFFEGKAVFAGYEDGFGTDRLILYANKL